MKRSSVNVLLVQLQGHQLALELHLVSSILAREEAEGMRQLDPGPYLPDTGAKRREHTVDNRRYDRMVLLDLPGPPTAVRIGEVLGTHELTTDDMLAMPRWMAAMLPPVFAPGCAWLNQKVVWLLNLDTLNHNPPS